MYSQNHVQRPVFRKLCLGLQCMIKNSDLIFNKNGKTLDFATVLIPHIVHDSN